MAKRFDVAAPRPKKDGGTFWARVGTAWQNDNGSIQVIFDALPLPDSEGRCVVNLFEPREDRARSAGNDRADSRERAQSNYDDLDDRVPF